MHFHKPSLVHLQPPVSCLCLPKGFPSSKGNQIVYGAKRETQGLLMRQKASFGRKVRAARRTGLSHSYLWGIIKSFIRVGPCLHNAGRIISLCNIAPNSSCTFPVCSSRWWEDCFVYCLIYHCWASCLREAQFKIDWKVVSVNWINTDGFPQKNWFFPSPKTQMLNVIMFGSQAWNVLIPALATFYPVERCHYMGLGALSWDFKFLRWNKTLISLDKGPIKSFLLRKSEGSQ